MVARKRLCWWELGAQEVFPQWVGICLCYKSKHCPDFWHIFCRVGVNSENYGARISIPDSFLTKIKCFNNHSDSIENSWTVFQCKDYLTRYTISIFHRNIIRHLYIERAPATMKCVRFSELTIHAHLSNITFQMCISDICSFVSF